MNHAFSREEDSIVVSGVGVVSPLGIGRELTWSRLLEGRSGVLFTEDGLEARVLDFSPNGARSRTSEFALLAASEAIEQAGLSEDTLASLNVACTVSQSKPILHTMDPELVLSSFFGWSPDALIKKKFNLTGPSSNFVSACATGITSLEVGAHWIQSGQCDVVLAGAAESSLTGIYRAGFRQMDVLVHGESPQTVQPFDLNRSGFAMGEGAAVLLLEKLSSAKLRGHEPLAIFKKAVLQHSASDSIRFDPEGVAVGRLIAHATKGGATPGYINAHGTATQYNDRVETRGIKLALGRRAYQTPVSSTKAATGHLLGAAGALEAIFSVLALRDQKIPPTLNLVSPDPECDLDYITEGSRAVSMETALSLSYGFGGQMGAVLFERWYD